MSATLISTLLEHCWQSTVVVLMAWVLVRTLLRNNGPQVRYVVYFAASMKFLIPFSLLQELGSRLAWIRPAPVNQSVTWNFASDQLTRVAAAMATPASLTAATSKGIGGENILWLLWICGVMVVVVKWWRSWGQARAAIESASPLNKVDGIAILSAPLLRDRGLEPGVYGLFRPVVVVPEGIGQHLTEEQFEAVVAHETCHVRRRDNLAAAGHMLVEAVFWFHPAVWWLGRRLMEERERACDEAVLRRTNDPAVYAEAILKVCKFYVAPPLPCVAGVTGSDLKQRIEEIMTHSFGERVGSAKRVVLVVAGVIAVVSPLMVGLLRAQAPTSFGGLTTVANKKFEVATIKLNLSGSPGWQLGPPAKGSVAITNLELKKIIASSFRIQDSMVFGPGWMDSTHYDIVGKGPDATVANPEVWEMMRSLLAERFHMKYHLESRETPVYALRVAKSGIKLRKPEDGQCAEAIRAGQNCGDIRFLPYGVGIYNMPIGALIGGLGRKLQDRPIVDKTGLTGKYDVDVMWLPDGVKLEDTRNAPKEFQPEDISLFEAMEKQAGLKLEREKLPIQVVVIDSIDRPTEN